MQLASLQERAVSSGDKGQHEPFTDPYFPNFANFPCSKHTRLKRIMLHYIELHYPYFTLDYTTLHNAIVKEGLLFGGGCLSMPKSRSSMCTCLEM